MPGLGFQVSRFLGIQALLIACAHAEPPPAEPPPPAPIPIAYATVASTAPNPPPVPNTPAPVGIGDVESGRATWYGKVLAGHKTASGERFDPSKLTAAHKTLPLGTWVDVRRPGTNKVVRVRINDRGPFGEADRIIDLSRAAFEHLGSIREGVIPVEVRVVALPVKR